MIDLTDSYRGYPFTPSGLKRLRKLVHQMMEQNGESGHSASGRSALLAIKWCEEHAQGWTLIHVNGGGYMVEAMK